MSAADFEEFEELEQFDALEEAGDVIEEGFDDAVDAVEEGATAQTSVQSEVLKSADTATTDDDDDSSRTGWLRSLTVYDAMLLTSLLAISLAGLLMLMELFSFGFPFFQWRTGEALIEPLRPPV